MAILILKYQEIPKKEGNVFINIEYGDTLTGRENRKCQDSIDNDDFFIMLKNEYAANGLATQETWDKFKKPIYTAEEKAAKKLKIEETKRQKYLDDLARKAQENG